MKPGIVSTEFWTTVITALIGLATAASESNTWVSIAALALVAIVVVAYVWSRTKIKEFQEAVGGE